MPKEPEASQREAVMLAILLNGERYGREVRNEYESRTGKAMPLGSLYVTLDRMEDKGFLRSRMGDPDPERGGNRRKYYTLTASGHRALDRAQAMAAALKGGVANA